MDCRFRSSLLLLVLGGALLGAASGGLELHSVDGEAVRLRPESADAPLVLHFWATWCPSCVEELGVLDAAVRDCLAAGVQVVAVNVGEDAATIRQYLGWMLVELGGADVIVFTGGIGENGIDIRDCK